MIGTAPGGWAGAALGHGFRIAPLDASDLDTAGSDDADQVADWQRQGRALGLCVDTSHGTAGIEVQSFDFKNHERNQPRAARETTCVAVGGRRIYLFSASEGLRPPTTVIGEPLGLTATPVVVPMPPARGAEWLRDLDHLKPWPWTISRGQRPRQRGRARISRPPGARSREDCPTTSGHASPSVLPDLRSLAYSPFDVADSDPPRPPSLIGEGHVSRGDIFLLSGAPGEGKSWLLLDLAFRMVSGQPWLGVPTLTEPGIVRVGLLLYEIPYFRLAERTAALRQHRAGTALPYREESCRSLVRVIPKTDECGLPLALPCPLLGDGTPERIAEWVEAERLDVLLTDPLYRVVGSEQMLVERSAEVMLAFERIQRLVSRPLTIGVSNHDRKAGSGGDSGKAMDRMYGGRFLGAAAQLVFSVARTRAGVRRLELGKSNWGKHSTFSEIFYALSEEDGGVPVRVERPPKGASQEREREVGLAVEALWKVGGWQKSQVIHETYRQLGGSSGDKTLKEYLNSATEVKSRGNGKAREWRCESEPSA